MSYIFKTCISQTTDWLIQNFAHKGYKNYTIEAWLFADEQHRKHTELELQKFGIKAKIRSAYKPLIHFFLEEFNTPYNKIKKVEIAYPIHPSAPEKRFLLESYPLHALLSNINIEFVDQSLNKTKRN